MKEGRKSILDENQDQRSLGPTLRHGLYIFHTALQVLAGSLRASFDIPFDIDGGGNFLIGLLLGLLYCSSYRGSRIISLPALESSAESRKFGHSWWTRKRKHAGLRKSLERERIRGKSFPLKEMTLLVAFPTIFDLYPSSLQRSSQASALPRVFIGLSCLLIC